MNLSILTAIAVAMAATALYVYLKQRKPNERASSPGETEPRPVVPQTLSPSPISRPQKRDYVVISVPVEEALPELVLKPPAAWFAFISGLHVAGPYENETIADRAGKGASNVADKVDIDHQPDWHRTVRQIYRADLSTAPFHVWEFRSGLTRLFAVAGSDGWVGSTSMNPVIIQEDAARRAESHRISLENPDDEPGNKM